MVNMWCCSACPLMSTDTHSALSLVRKRDTVCRATLYALSKSIGILNRRSITMQTSRDRRVEWLGCTQTCWEPECNPRTDTRVNRTIMEWFHTFYPLPTQIHTIESNRAQICGVLLALVDVLLPNAFNCPIHSFIHYHCEPN